jgi:hypothetical protein
VEGANMKRESIIQGFLICAALIFVVLASGCLSIGPTVRTYSGDKLQKSEVAVIKGWWMSTLLGYEGLDIFALDGNNLGATKVEVLPGKHGLIIRNYSYSFVTLSETLPRYAGAEFNFEAGHEYKINYRYKGILIEGVKIIDVTTGAIIREPSLYP